MNTVLFFLAEDDTAPARQKYLMWQDALMKHFMSGLSEKNTRILSSDTRFKPTQLWDVCHPENWPGINCDSKTRVTEIAYRDIKFGNFNLDALPSSTQKVTLFKCGQTFAISTRGWPRNLVKIDLANNRIHGRPDLTTLPEKLQEASFYKNRLHGPIVLSNLPPDLRRMYLQENRFQQDTVYYQHLPERLEKIHFQYYDDKKKPFRECCAVNGSPQVDDRKKFVGIDWVDGVFYEKERKIGGNISI